jgi:hypothetical protein
MIARLLLLAVLVLTLAACSGDDDENSPQAGGATTSASGSPHSASEAPVGAPQESVEDFLGAIESADQNLSWGLLSSDTKVTFQIDKQHWVEVLMPALKKELSPTGKVLFQKKFGPDKALVVVDAGRKKTPVAFALRGEGGEWHMQLFYPEFTPTRPAPGETVKAGKTPLLLDVVRRRDADMTMQVFMDGKEVPVTVQDRGNFLVTYAGTLNAKPGSHLLVAYATTDTSNDLAGGTAWRFSAK